MNSITYFALDWVTTNLQRFNPLYKDTSVPYPQYQTCLAELSLLCYQLDKSKIEIPEIDKYIDFIAEVYNEPTIYMYPFNVDNRAFIGHLIIWLTLNQRGIDHPISKEKIQKFINESNICSIKRPAFRNLELRYFLEDGNFIHGLQDDDDIFRDTYLGNCLVAPNNFQDIYDITHTAFYITDFGRYKYNKFFNNVEDTVILMQQTIDFAIKTGNWDLLSELILACQCMNLLDRIDTERIFKVLEVVQDNEGFIPGLNFAREELDHMFDKEIHAEYLFLRCYHPTLVTIMAGFLKNK